MKNLNASLLKYFSHHFESILARNYIVQKLSNNNNKKKKKKNSLTFIRMPPFGPKNFGLPSQNLCKIPQYQPTKKVRTYSRKTLKFEGELEGRIQKSYMSFFLNSGWNWVIQMSENGSFEVTKKFF